MYTRANFTTQFSPYISNLVRGTGLLTGTVIAQAIIESQGKVNGTYYVGGSTLSQKANNYFGIKCHGWSGRGFNIDTGEQHPDGTKYIHKNACFRAYDSVQDSIKDYVNFLLTNPRYREAGVFNAPTVEEQAKALKRAKYATNPDYAGLVTGVYDGIKNYIIEAKVTLEKDPKAFIKQNWWVFLLLLAFLAGIGVVSYKLIKTRK